jgi:serine/threonine protein kinase
MLEETLSFEEQHAAEQHVDECQACQLRLDAMVAGDVDGQLPLRDLSADLLGSAPQPTGATHRHAQPPGDNPTTFSPPREPTGHERTFPYLDPSPEPNSLGRLAHYDVLEVIGRGGMGIVFKARDLHLHRIVAIKALAPELASSGAARQRFLREARAAAAISHDHIITIYAVEQGPVPYLVMELIDGQSLQQKIEQSGHLDLVEILQIGYQIASGLAAAHALGLTHRDIKPANILLQNGIQRVQVTDFGLARAADDAGITAVGEVAGTPQYMSPEQAQGHSTDARSDLFSLGSVLYAMAAGRSPFRAESTVAVLRRVCDEAPLPIHELNPEIPPWLASIINKLLAKDPDQRYQTAAEVAALLSKHLADAQQSRPRPESSGNKLPVAPIHPSSRARRWRWAGLVALLVAGALMAAEAVRRANLGKSSVGQNAHETAAAGAAAPASSPPTMKPWPADAPPPANVPFDDVQALSHQQAWAAYLDVPVEVTNSVGMKLRLIPPGEFVMGSPPADIAEALDNREDPFFRDTVKSEAPQHKVQLSEPWFVGVHEVTQEQYEAVCGENPSYFSPLGEGQYEVADLDTQSFPVEKVSWKQSAQFCNALSRREGLPETYVWKGEACSVRPGAGYHLPTEAQWEFACRAGTDTRYWFAASGEELNAYGWYRRNSLGRTHTVGELRANPFGIHDLLGNVSEWCQDGWQLSYFAQFNGHTAVDPTGPSADFFFHSLRGGNIRYSQLGSRSAKRAAGGPNLTLDHVGLRVAISVDGVKTLLRSQRAKSPAPSEQSPDQPPGPIPRGEPP